MWKVVIDRVANGYVVLCQVGRPLIDRQNNPIEGRVMVASSIDEATQIASDFGEEVEAGRPAPNGVYNLPSEQARLN